MIQQRYGKCLDNIRAINSTLTNHVLKIEKGAGQWYIIDLCNDHTGEWLTAVHKGDVNSCLAFLNGMIELKELLEQEKLEVST